MAEMAQSSSDTMAAKPKKVNEAFFSIGQSLKGQPNIVDDEDEHTWRNIKPNQELDALNKEVYKKRKFEEYRQRQQAASTRNDTSKNW